MKNDQQQQAKHLYFQTDLNKTEIAEMLGVNRRTVMLWVQQGNWDRLKLSSQHLPSMVVEKCYYMLNHYLDNLLSANATISTFGPKEASAINQLATAIKKVRNRSAVNESMEMMSFFLDDVRRKDPAMAGAITPFIEQYIATRKDTNLADFLPANFNDQGFVNEPTEDIMEQWLDEQAHAKMEREAAMACHGEPAEPVIPQEEEVLIKSFRDNCEETRVMRPVKGSFGATSSPNTSGNASNPNRNTDGTSPSGQAVEPPTKPYTPTTGNAQGLPTISDHKTFYERRKLREDIEKQLGEYLKQTTTQNSTAA
jgi:hypothetical protein